MKNLHNNERDRTGGVCGDCPNAPTLARAGADTANTDLRPVASNSFARTHHTQDYAKM